MEALITGLVLAGMSGLTVLAFQNQGGFARLFPLILAGASALFLGLVIWHAAVIVSWMQLGDFVHDDRMIQARAALHAIQLPYLWVAVGYAFFAGYLWLLLRLPPFLKETGKRDSGRPRKRS